MKTVKQVSRLSGVSVRALHHYDAIGLLKPTRVTEAGYRLYDDTALRRLQTILLFRELEFPLKEIAQILDSPGFDPALALQEQIELLELRREHLEKLISHARQLQETGGIPMEFSAFDKSKMEAYAAQAKERWGGTEAYRQCEQRTKGQSAGQQKAAGDALMRIFAELGQIRHTPPEGEAAQALIEKLQRFITDHYYTCTPQILLGLGQLYVAGDDMTANIDAAGGEGTAQFVNKAIEAYCRGKV
ncbi:MAG: MerR family transcriptional regulator [Faecousia sp.]